MTDKEVMQSAMNEHCPACGYYCLGNGGVYCIDKPTTVETTRACLAQPEQYDQTELELCKKCGWKAVWPDGCLVCEKQKMMTDKEVMQMALDALECWQRNEDCNEPMSNILETLRTALAQPESAECDGGKCGIGGYCKQCPKTQPDVPETAFGETEPVAIKFQIYKQTPQRGRELEPINSALLPWVYDQDPSSGNTASMWVTPVATLPPQREWKGLTDDEYELMAEKRVTNYFFNTLDYAHDIEAKLKEKNT